jgi:manganese efflux pump family protein
MLTPTVLLTAIGLAMDAVAVSIASGLAERKLHFRNALKMAFFFGLFQALMPFAGFFLGLSIAEWVSAWSAWIVFLVLLILGIKMIREARTVGDEPLHSPFRTNKLVALAVATSIDAFAVGVGFSLLDSGLVVTCATIGLVTFLLCLPAVWFGAKLGKRFAQRAEIFGGLVLIAIGCKILLEHLLKGV